MSQTAGPGNPQYVLDRRLKTIEKALLALVLDRLNRQQEATPLLLEAETQLRAQVQAPPP